MNTRATLLSCLQGGNARGLKCPWGDQEPQDEILESHRQSRRRPRPQGREGPSWLSMAWPRLCVYALSLTSALAATDVAQECVQARTSLGSSPSSLPSPSSSWSTSAVAMEVLNMPFVGLFLAYVVIFCIGSWLNCRLATRWLQDVWPVLSAEFYCVGIPLRTTEELKTKQIAQPFRSGVLQAENYRSFRLYASGRRNCMCCLIDLDFRPRQDCLALSYSLLSEWRDLLFVDVPFIPGKVEPFVFSILRRKDLAFAKQTMHDVAAYTRPVPLELLPSGLLCMTDCSELVAHFLSPSIVKSLQALREYIELIHISDENTISCFGPNQVHREAMRFRLRMPRSAQDRRALLSLVFSFVDLAAGTKLSNDARLAAKRLRASSKDALGDARPRRVPSPPPSPPLAPPPP